MLSKVLSKESCAACRFCCSFRRQSLWELPRLPLEFAAKYTHGYNNVPVHYHIIAPDDCEAGAFAVTALENLYRTEDPEEEVPCPFLDPHAGCTLPPEDKPFECSAWPLRYMQMPDGSRKVCLTPTCPSVNQVDLCILRKLTAEGFKAAFASYAEQHPYIVKEYREGFPLLEP